MSTKYPRTPHLPYSPGGTSDDRRMLDVSGLLGRPVIITEKADGSNVSLETANVFARSHSASPNHPSFAPLKAFHAGIRHEIPRGAQVFGEWCFARHSIDYSSLPSYLLLFGVRHNDSLWTSWEDVEVWAEIMGTHTVPVLHRGVFEREQDLKAKVEELASQPSALGGEREGVVVRVASAFNDTQFSRCVAKFVRANHVQTEEHWKHQEVRKNGLKA